MQDEWSEHASTMLKCFMAEGVACKQQLLHGHHGLEPTGLLTQLPRLVSKKSVAAASTAVDSASGRGQESELKIAWQYRR